MSSRRAGRAFLRLFLASSAERLAYTVGTQSVVVERLCSVCDLTDTISFLLHSSWISACYVMFPVFLILNSLQLLRNTMPHPSIFFLLLLYLPRKSSVLPFFRGPGDILGLISVVTLPGDPPGSLACAKSASTELRYPLRSLCYSPFYVILKWSIWGWLPTSPGTHLYPNSFRGRPVSYSTLCHISK